MDDVLIQIRDARRVIADTLQSIAGHEALKAKANDEMLAALGEAATLLGLELVPSVEELDKAIADLTSEAEELAVKLTTRVAAVAAAVSEQTL